MIGAAVFGRARQAPPNPIFRGDQVLTEPAAHRWREISPFQVLSLVPVRRKPLAPSSYVLSASHLSERERLPKRSRKKRRRGGWKATAGLAWSDIKLVSAIDHALVTAGFGRAFFVTQRSAGETDSERKRYLHKKRGHLGQAIERAGLPSMIVTTFQKPLGGLLHSHSIVYGPPKAIRPIIARIGVLDERRGGRDRELGVETHVRPAVPSDPGYMTRQRRSLPPEAERAVSHRRVKGEFVPGKMLSLSAAVADLMADLRPPAAQEEPTPAPAYVAPSPQLVAVVAAQVAPLVPIIEEAGGQLAFSTGEPVNLAAEAEKRRRALGMSQEAAAARLGISRPTFANAAAGRYRLSPWALQRASEFLQAA